MTHRRMGRVTLCGADIGQAMVGGIASWRFGIEVTSEDSRVSCPECIGLMAELAAIDAED